MIINRAGFVKTLRKWPLISFSDIICLQKKNVWEIYLIDNNPLSRSNLLLYSIQNESEAHDIMMQLKIWLNETH